MTSNERGMNPSDSKGNVELAAIPKLTPRARPSARSVVTVPRGYIIASEKWKGTDLTRALQGTIFFQMRTKLFMTLVQWIVSSVKYL